jgi:hypothetical protein
MMLFKGWCGERMANSTKNILSGLVKNEPVHLTVEDKGNDAVVDKSIASPSTSLADTIKYCLDNSTPRKDKFDLTPQS